MNFIFRQKKLEKVMDEEGLPDEEVNCSYFIFYYVVVFDKPYTVCVR